MDNRQNPPKNQADRRGNVIEDLHLDRVVASQPELGPTPPDGGYGWLIVFSAVIYHVTVPGVLTLYGLIILKAIKEEDHEEDEQIRIWDVDIALVPVIMIVIRLLLESWCRAVVKTFNMPRFMALSGLCMTVAGILLSSYSTDANSNDHIINVFSGIFAGAGCALTGQQTEVIITHYFRERLTMAQRVVRMAPSVGNCLVPILVGYLCSVHSGDVVVMVYGAVLMQNCVFLASFSRPIYIERVIRSTYNMLRDAVEDEDEVIFSNQRREDPEKNDRPQSSTAQDDDATDVVVFKSKKNAKEIVDPAFQYREKNAATITSQENQPRFSTDFSEMFTEPSNRFSSDFGSLDVTSYSRISGYRELESIDRAPQPLYRETTTDAPQSVVFAEVSAGTARRTASLRKNFITVANMLLDLNFYLYALLHLTTTVSIFVLGVFFGPLVWVKIPTMNIWAVSSLMAVAHGSALCFIMLCVVLPKSINEKARLCALICAAGAMGFYGITLSANKSLLLIWCMFASFSTAAAGILQQPLYNSTLNEFDTTATLTAANAIVAGALLAWTLAFNYRLVTCFETAAILQMVTALVFLASSFRRRR